MTIPECKRRFSLLLTLFIAFSAFADDNPFPLPDELKPDVDFWVAVFTDYSSDEGLLHDNRRLSVVYERVAISSTTSRRERQRRVNARRKHYQRVLRTLAGGKRKGLSDEEQRVLEL